MKLEDPVAPFRGIVAEYRRTRPAPDTEIFRFGGHAPTHHVRPSKGPVAVLGASDWALDASRAEKTFAHIGMLGGVLADLGYDVYTLGALPAIDRHPSFIGWIGGEESELERAQLDALGVPGLTVGRAVDGVALLGNVEPDDHPDSIALIRNAFDEIRRLTAEDAARSDEPGNDPSTPSSTPRAGTEGLGRTRADTGQPRNPSSRARSGTGWDRTNERPSDS